MNKTNGTVASAKGTSTLVRAKFGPGMLLQHEDLEQLNSYTRDLSRLLFKSFFGCGVVCGLVVKVDPKCGKVCITVGAGLAHACSGDPIYVPKDQTFALDENCDPNLDGPLWVVLCGTVRQCAPRTAMCASDDEETPAEPTRQRDGFEIRVVRGTDPPKCACSCAERSRAASSTPDSQPAVILIEHQRRGADYCMCADPNLPCHKGHYAGTCGCNCDECSDEDCKCILLAKLIKNNDDKENPWRVDHRVRRFIRPVLMRDPQVEEEDKHRDDKTDQGEIRQLKEKLIDSVQKAERLIQELDDSGQMITELQNRMRTSNAELELVGPQPSKTPEAKSQREVLRKASKKPEENA